uniref:Peregrin n=1 Tax=Ascaris suum TaxID=6253 RepID=F1KS97_ASCSU
MRMQSSNNVDRFVTVNVDGQSVRVNVMQPLRVKIVYDEQLSPSERSDVILSHLRKVPQGLPEPKFTRIEDDIVERGRFVMPKAYIDFVPKCEAELDATVEYDADEEDLEWITLINEKMGSKKDAALTLTQFEAAMDRMEKESFFQSTKDGMQCGPPIDQDAVCCICNDGDGCNANQIIFCDLCNIAVHQDCYGVPYIPEGQWLCRRCQMSPSKPVQCELCPCPHGAFKRTVANGWAHVVCALWLNEVHFANTVFMEPIDGIENSLKRRCRLRCIVCKQKMGACLQCSKKSCTRSYHVTCARAAGMELRAEEVKNANSDWGSDIKYLSFCHYHSNTFNKENLTTCDLSKKKKEVEAMMRAARRELQSNESTAPAISVPVVPAHKVEEMRTNLGINAEVMRRLLVYWTLKRKSRSGVPLLKRLMQSKVQSREMESIPTVEIDDPEHKSFVLLRADLEKVRLLCELVKKREKYKKEYLKETNLMFDYSTKPLHLLMSELLDKIAAKDFQDVFARAVSEKEVPGYSSIIKKPMDLSKMRRKLAKGEYKQLAQLKADFALMINNCSTFNRHNEFFWKYGHRLQRIALKYFKAAERAVAFVGMTDDLNSSMLNVTSLLLERVSRGKHEANQSKNVVKHEREGSPVVQEVSFARNRKVITNDTRDVKVDSEPSCSGIQSSATKTPGSQHARKVSFSNQTTRKRSLKNSSPVGRCSKKLKAMSQLPITRFLVPVDVPNADGELSPAGGLSSRRKRMAGIIAAASFDVYRSHSLLSPANDLTTDNSSAIEESSSAGEDLASPKPAGKYGRQRSIRRRKIAWHQEPVIDTVEIGQDVQHDDIVWVEDGDSRMVGHVVDLCMKVLLDSYPVDEMMAKRPKNDPQQFVLVQFFDKHHTWRWVPLKCVSQCDVQKANSFPASLQSAINEARKFRDARL